MTENKPTHLLKSHEISRKSVGYQSYLGRAGGNCPFVRVSSRPKLYTQATLSSHSSGTYLGARPKAEVRRQLYMGVNNGHTSSNQPARRTLHPVSSLNNVGNCSSGASTFMTKTTSTAQHEGVNRGPGATSTHLLASSNTAGMSAATRSTSLHHSSYKAKLTTGASDKFPSLRRSNLPLQKQSTVTLKYVAVAPPKTPNTLRKYYGRQVLLKQNLLNKVSMCSESASNEVEGASMLPTINPQSSTLAWPKLNNWVPATPSGTLTRISEVDMGDITGVVPIHFLGNTSMVPQTPLDSISLLPQETFAELPPSVNQQESLLDRSRPLGQPNTENYLLNVFPSLLRELPVPVENEVRCDVKRSFRRHRETMHTGTTNIYHQGDESICTSPVLQATKLVPQGTIPINVMESISHSTELIKNEPAGGVFNQSSNVTAMEDASSTIPMGSSKTFEMACIPGPSSLDAIPTNAPIIGNTLSKMCVSVHTMSSHLSGIQSQVCNQGQGIVIDNKSCETLLSNFHQIMDCIQNVMAIFSASLQPKPIYKQNDVDIENDAEPTSSNKENIPENVTITHRPVTITNETNTQNLRNVFNNNDVSNDAVGNDQKRKSLKRSSSSKQSTCVSEKQCCVRYSTNSGSRNKSRFSSMARKNCDTPKTPDGVGTSKSKKKSLRSKIALKICDSPTTQSVAGTSGVKRKCLRSTIPIKNCDTGSTQDVAGTSEVIRKSPQLSMQIESCDLPTTQSVAVTSGVGRKSLRSTMPIKNCDTGSTPDVAGTSEVIRKSSRLSMQIKSCDNPTTSDVPSGRKRKSRGSEQLLQTPKYDNRGKLHTPLQRDLNTPAQLNALTRKSLSQLQSLYDS